MRRIFPLLLALAAGTVGGCDDELAPVAGTLRVVLATPNSKDGAVLFVVSGGPIDQVEPTGYLTYSTPIGSAGTRVVVTGDLIPGTLVNLRVPDINRVGSYSAVLEEVASRGPGYTLQNVGGYGITVAR